MLDATQAAYLQSRIEQVKALFAFLQQHLPLAGERTVSIGCGTGPDLALLQNFPFKTGIDHDPTIIEFCKMIHPNVEFVCTDYLLYLDGCRDNSIDLFLALDIDTNILPQLLVRKALPKLKPGGAIIFTERENNIAIYNRMLLLPFVDEIKKESTARLFARLNPRPDKNDRDNIILIVRP